MKLLSLILTLSFLTTSAFANSTVIKKPVAMINAEISIAIESHDQCVRYYDAATIRYTCAYKIGFTIPEFGQIKKAQVVGQEYFDTSYTVRENKLIVSFVYEGWVDDDDFTEKDRDSFAEEVAEYLKVNKMSYVFLYSGLDVEIDESIIGSPAAL